jgi:hypothetical protein
MYGIPPVGELWHWARVLAVKATALIFLAPRHVPIAKMLPSDLNPNQGREGCHVLDSKDTSNVHCGIISYKPHLLALQ